MTGQGHSPQIPQPSNSPSQWKIPILRWLVVNWIGAYTDGGRPVIALGLLYTLTTLKGSHHHAANSSVILRVMCLAL